MLVYKPPKEAVSRRRPSKYMYRDKIYGCQYHFPGAMADLNRATRAQLMEVPGIDAASASKILNFRRENAVFVTKEELLKAGIPSSTYYHVLHLTLPHYLSIKTLQLLRLSLSQTVIYLMTQCLPYHHPCRHSTNCHFTLVAIVTWS